MLFALFGGAGAEEGGLHTSVNLWKRTTRANSMSEEALTATKIRTNKSNF